MSTFLAPITKLSNSIIRILGCNPGPMTLQGTNTYLIGTGKLRVLLDTGEPNIPEYIETLKQVLQNEGAILSDVIISHWHNDHIGGILDLMKNVQSNLTVWKHHRAGDEVESLPAEVNFKFLQDRQKIITEGIDLEVIHTPGHTSDHIILWAPKDKVVFSADCILGEGTTVFEDLFTYLKSLEFIRSLKPSVIYPGHGPVVSNPEEKINFYIEHRMKRENQILSLMKSNPNSSLSTSNIVNNLYEGLAENLLGFAKHTVQLHLTKLRKEGKVTEENDQWRLNSKL